MQSSKELQEEMIRKLSSAIINLQWSPKVPSVSLPIYNPLLGDTKGTFHAKMGSIKDRNGMDLTEAEDI